MTDKIKRIDQETFELLLPWFVTGRLSEGEMQQVTQFLSDNPGFSKQVELARDEQDEVMVLNEELVTPSSGALDRLLEKIADDGQEPEVDRIQWLRSQANDFFANIYDQLRPVAMAAVACILIMQTVAFSFFILDQTTGDKVYQPVSKTECSAKTANYEFIVSFAPQATVSDITGFLQSIDAEVVDGPKANGFYKLKVCKPEFKSGEKAALLKTLQGKAKLIKIALPAS